MNKKVLTYVLLTVVIGIWGRIIYTSFFEGTGEENIAEPQVFQKLAEQEEKTIEKIDLMADYRDPFLGGRTRSVARNTFPRTSRTKTKQTEKTQSPENIVWPEIDYFGLVKNRESSDKIAIVKIKKKQVLLKEGQEFEDLSMLKIYNDSILLSISTERRTFLKN